MKRLSIALALIACLAAPGVAYAGPLETYTWTINYQLRTTDPFITNLGVWGTLTISDSPDDPERVDLHLIANPPGPFVTLDQVALFLNVQPPAGVTFPNRFRMLPIGAPEITGTVAGTAITGSATSYTQNNYNAAGTPNSLLFDMWLGLSSPTYNEIHTSLSLQNPGDPQINLDASMFNVTTPCITSTLGPLCVYAAFEGHFSSGQSDTSFGATGRGITVTAVPEPGSLLLLGTGLLGVAVWQRRRSVR
jgi:hypothetical protein